MQLFFPPFLFFSLPFLIQCTMSHLCTSVQKHLYIFLMCTVNLNLIFSFCLTHTHKYPFTHCLYFSFFMWTQYTPLVARKPFEHFFPPLVDIWLPICMFCVCVCVCSCACAEVSAYISRERSCQAELRDCSTIQPSNNNEPLTLFDRGHRLSSPVATVVNVWKAPDALWCKYISTYVCIHVHNTLCLTGSVLWYNPSSCFWCWPVALSIVLQRAIAKEDSGQVGPSCSWAHISPPCDSLFRNAPAHLTPLAAPVKSWFAHRHGQRHINSTPCRLAQRERQHTRTNKSDSALIWKRARAKERE